MSELPKGTVTLVFTDIEGSTRLLASLGSRYEEVLASHRALLREAFRSHGGVEVDTQGDALFYAFARAQDAVAGAVAAQRALASHDFGEGVELRVRLGIHSGEPSLSDEGYVGADVHLGARISAAAWGGQIVVSSATAALVGGDSDEISLRSLGEHALKDIEGRVELHQVVAPGLREDFPALRSVSAHPTNLPARLPPLIGREDEIAAVAELLSSEDVSVVTVVGPGGTGKTRVALAVGAEVLSSVGDGVFFVDLSALSDASLVVPAIAQALSLREAPGRSLAETLGDYLSSKEMVLILDNFEQVMAAAGEVSALVGTSS
ncbi:MAG TPA: adenylate/guanylate cyclase domain-containing protein, partial [Actinomycetota bacterium]|nr:adenylate/guanylate cyclase domain-containing protein [Actinomycetota bacterium]